MVNLHHHLLTSGDRVAVAVSGGGDSVALVWLLRDLSAERGFELAGLVHVNHQLRGEASDEDEAFCRALAERLQIPFDVTRVDVRALAQASRQSIEAAARTARYVAFDAAMDRLGATTLATGHTRDDQAETVLLRLLRGAGTRGVAGIRLRRGRIIRPLLDCRRADLREWLAERGEMFREDQSNDDVSIARNRIRHELLPVIARIAPTGVEALGRFAELAAADDDWLTKSAIESAASVVLSDEGAAPSGVALDVAALNRLPPALAGRVILMAASRVSARSALSLRHLDAVLALAGADKTDGHTDLPGLAIDRSGGVLRIRGARGRAESATYDRALPVPGMVELPGAGGRISASVAPRAGGRVMAGTVATLQSSALTLPLRVRNRRDGDRLRPLGAPGRRKLQDLLVDRKVPRAERDSVPLVVDAGGRIVWVAGVTIAHECRVTAPEAGVVILELST